MRQKFGGDTGKQFDSLYFHYHQSYWAAKYFFVKNREAKKISPLAYAIYSPEKCKHNQETVSIHFSLFIGRYFCHFQANAEPITLELFHKHLYTGLKIIELHFVGAEIVKKLA